MTTELPNQPQVFRAGKSWHVDWHCGPNKPRVSEMPDKATALRCVASADLLAACKDVVKLANADPSYAIGQPEFYRVRSAIAAAEGASP